MRYSRSFLIFILSIFYSNCTAQNVSEKAAIKRFQIFKEKFNPIDSFPVVGKRLPNGSATNKISFDEATEILAIHKDSLYYWEEFYNHDTDVRTRGKRLNCFPVARFRYTCKMFTCLIYNAFTSLNDGALYKTMLSTFNPQGKIVDSVVLMTEMITYDGIAYNAFGLKSSSKIFTYTYDTYTDIDDGKPNTEIRCYEISESGKIILESTDKLVLKSEDYSDPEIANWHSDDPMLNLINE